MEYSVQHWGIEFNDNKEKMSYRPKAKGSDPLSDAQGGKGGPKGLTKYQQQLKGKQGQGSVRIQGQSERKYPTKSSSEKAKARADGDEIDSKFGFNRLKEVNFVDFTSVIDKNILNCFSYLLYRVQTALAGF